MISAPARRHWRLQAVAAILIAVLAALVAVPWLEPRAGDWALALAPSPGAVVTNQIVVVAITEDTLSTFPYRSPVDRAFLAGLIARLDDAGARVVGLDILIDQPSEPIKDARFFKTLDAVSVPVVLALATRDDGLTDRQADYVARTIAPQPAGLVALARDEVDGVLRHLPSARPGNATFAQSLADNAAKPISGRILYSRAVDEAAPFPVYPAHLVARLPDDWFAGKFILIGTDLPTIDRHPTPLTTLEGSTAGTLPGVVIHAHVLAQTLAGLSLRPLPPLAGGVAIVAAALLAAAGFSTGIAPRHLFIALALALVGYLAVAGVLIARAGVLPPLIAPPLAAIVAGGLVSLARWRADHTDRAFLRHAFAQYVSPSVVERIASGRLHLGLGGEKREVTFLFTDLEGFTSLSERLPPPEVADLLNAYLDRICELMTEHGATIDKIIGDAVVCFFGAPDDDPDQAEHAFALALALDGFAEAHRKRLLEEKAVALGVTRIGVHSGEAVIGNFGGSRFFDYTGVGDTVNTAARLEGANKYLGTRILVSETVARACRVSCVLRPAANLVLKGRDSALACFEPLPAEEAAAEWFTAYTRAFKQLVAHHEDASAGFEKVLALKPQDPLARLHLARLQAGEEGATLTLDGK
ncbi:adenylate/guanylate cyclase domain-containing protein [Stappia sp. ES.058]|uniref:adenylate/guanylate cyclase domain-containing protein n=1 Tax=Stappia sp. ES.058 TaxID=1881061 RepID=UPI00087C360F|nr:adenylate/guanylate cyclase domain-containing protein [Stappia sp. ES.058]SDU33534.1 adenylate/guanylate cyclase [Stappia sp. ES.058]